MVLRSDEAANEAEIERDQRFRSNVGKGIGTAAALGGATVSGALASKVLPFLNKYIPQDLAIKGISKVSPRLGDFLKKGQSMGLNVEEGLNFIKDKLPEQTLEKPKENRNIIQQYSPELHEFLDQEIKKGRNPLEAGAIAQNDKRFSKIINKLSKDHKTPWSNILQSVYGQGQQAQQSNDSSTVQQQNQQQNPGSGQQALMDILNKINQRLGQ